MPAHLWLLCLLALPGHVALWIWLTNQLHSLAPWQRVHTVTAALRDLLLLAAPAIVLWQTAALLAPAWSLPVGSLTATHPAALAPLAGYGLLCSAIALGPLPLWVARRLTVQPCPRLLADEVFAHNLAPHSHGHNLAGRLLLRLLGNESLTLHVHHRQLGLSRLPPALAGLSIVHLSDLHFTGRIGRSYFEQVVDQALALQGDLIVLTGDLIERAECLDWIDHTLARLRAPLGVYFVLGNHDALIDYRRTRQRLQSAGLVHLGSRWLLRPVRGETLLLAGNERPWFGREPYLAACPEQVDRRRPLRIALAHTPDQFAWARRHDFDLLLAGHTHGGQIQLPGLGPVLAPSCHGVEYASGTFYEPPTLMHVSRGISGELPLRYGAPPELTRLVLLPAAATPQSVAYRRAA